MIEGFPYFPEHPVPDSMPDSLNQRLDTLARRPFRAKFHLRGPERVKAELSDPSTLRWHAYDLIAKRLAPAEPYHDGEQTPHRGHPVFVAQHATATYCRTCSSAGTRSPTDGTRAAPSALRGGRDLPLDPARPGGCLPVVDH